VLGQTGHSVGTGRPKTSLASAHSTRNEGGIKGIPFISDFPKISLAIGAKSVY
jgi:hypothetical protein